MKVKDIIGLISALVLAVAVAFLTRYFLTRESGGKKTSTAQESNLETMKVLVAGRVLNEGDTIKVGDLIWLDWPKKTVQTNYVTPNVTNPQNLLGAVVRHHVSLKVPINLTDLAKPGDRGLLAAIISPGMYAISIDVNAQSVSSGLIFPGDRVDVILSKSVTNAGGIAGVISKTIVKNIKVLAVDIETASTREKPKTVPRVATLEVTERQAETITAAAKDGALSLSLHSLSKGKKGSEFGEEEGEQKGKHVVVIRGNERTEVQVRE